MRPIRVDLKQDNVEPHAWQLTITGDLDMTTIGAFDEAVDSLVAQGARLVVLDLGSVAFLDSTGLRGIVRASDALAEKHGQLTVAGLSGAAERVLEVTGLLERLRHEPSTTPKDRA
ncbi:MAG: STAS domain-containing protein [Acidimicrobiia bacterium]|nr:STAS domain-containing protein [Acidimicrobiia bacterium]